MMHHLANDETKSFIKFYLSGIGLGCLFILITWGIELSDNHISFTASNIALLHQNNSLNYLVDSIPIMLCVLIYGLVRHFSKRQGVMEKVLELTSLLEFERYERTKLDQQLSGIMERSPISYVIINMDGIITYVNPATKPVLGSADTINQNILEFSTVKNTPIEKCICSAMIGQVEQLQSYKHVSFTTGQEKYLNIVFMPLRWNETTGKNSIVMISLDLTNEIHLIKEIEESYLNLTKGLAKALDAKDQYTSFHSSNVRKYTELILEGVNLSSKEKADIITAADLHDIGKIGISDIILHKEGQLSDEEFAEMKKHPVIGANLFVDIKGYQDISGYIKHHHERVDGRGYPDGLKGDEIPIGAAIICVADAYDAMITDRVYRKALSQETALNELIRCRGSQFKAEFVDILVDKMQGMKI